MATTPFPTATVEEFPSGTVCSPEAPVSWRTAMSWERSYPTTVAR
ncbi:MAG TPA: hypothetical protein VK428_11730 [Acidimicrobiales bacterium]|nr:hypothetical protein [Acidimicrobiales bacterium]